VTGPNEHDELEWEKSTMPAPPPTMPYPSDDFVDELESVWERETLPGAAPSF
jgi:hypothetical protein